LPTRNERREAAAIEAVQFIRDDGPIFDDIEIGLVLGVKPAAVSLAVKRAGQRVRQDAALGEQVMAARSQMAKRLED